MMPESVRRFILYFMRFTARDYFYVNSDVEAITWIQEQLEVEYLDITNPPVELQTAILELVVQPQGVGSSFIRNILENSDLFSIRYELVKLFLRELYKLMWDVSEPSSEKIKYYVLHSPRVRNEVGWVEIEPTGSCKTDRLDFPFPPYSDDISVFIHHPHALELLKNATAPIVKAFSGGTLDTQSVKMALHSKYSLSNSLTDKLPELEGLPKFKVVIGSSDDDIVKP
jgi:hypothetical protein